LYCLFKFNLSLPTYGLSVLIAILFTIIGSKIVNR
jgi:hypothetical protein